MANVERTETKGKSQEYPETYDLKDGEAVILIPTDVRSVETKYGQRIVLDSVIFGKPEDKLWSVWLPRGIKPPERMQPWALKRIGKAEFMAYSPTTDDEKRALWVLGALPAVFNGSGTGAAPKKLALGAWAGSK